MRLTIQLYSYDQPGRCVSELRKLLLVVKVEKS